MSVIAPLLIKYNFFTIQYNSVYFECRIHNGHEILVYKSFLSSNIGNILLTFIKSVQKAKDPVSSHEVNKTVMQMEKYKMMMMMMIMMMLMMMMITSCSG